MKIRADFVTNSSSSCYVTSRIVTKDDDEYEGHFDGDEVGFEYLDSFLSTNRPDDEKTEKLKRAADGKEIIQAINEMYGGMFSDFEQAGTLFRSAQGRVESLERGEIKKIVIEENVESDNGSDSCSLTVNPESGETVYENAVDKYEASERPVEDLREVILSHSREDFMWAIEAIEDMAYREKAENCATLEEAADVVIEYAKNIEKDYCSSYYPFPSQFCEAFVDGYGETWEE